MRLAAGADPQHSTAALLKHGLDLQPLFIHGIEPIVTLQLPGQSHQKQLKDALPLSLQ